MEKVNEKLYKEIEEREILEATRKMVREFNTVSNTILFGSDDERFGDFNVLTKPKEGDFDEYTRECIVEIDEDNDRYYIQSGEDFEQEQRELLEEDPEYEVEEEREYYDIEDAEVYELKDPPTWGWCFNPTDSWIEDWIKNNSYTVSKLGFDILEHEETGDIFLGLKSGGLDFYEAYWIPLYKAMGLKWHEEETERKYKKALEKEE